MRQFWSFLLFVRQDFRIFIKWQVESGRWKVSGKLRFRILYRLRNTFTYSTVQASLYPTGFLFSGGWRLAAGGWRVASFGSAMLLYRLLRERFSVLFFIYSEGVMVCRRSLKSIFAPTSVCSFSTFFLLPLPAFSEFFLHFSA